MQPDQLKKIVEAALLAANQPLSAQQLAGMFSEDEAVGRADVGQALAALESECAGRGVELVEVASGFRYQVRQDVHTWVARMWTERPSRYSRALLETLALIAYRQPITRGEIEQVRGVTVATSIVRTLEEREWIRVVGYRDVPGKPALFGTTRHFLDYFKLKSLDQLPSLSEIRDLEEIDPELAFDGETDAAAAAIPARAAAEAAETDQDEAQAPATSEQARDADASETGTDEAATDDTMNDDDKNDATTPERPEEDAGEQQDIEETRA